MVELMEIVSHRFREDRRASSIAIYASFSCNQPSAAGPMVDDGASSSAIGELELRYQDKRLVLVGIIV